jgi:type II secretory pathway pseudopilin PulG
MMKQKRESGFGLVELVIYIALTLIILSAVGSVVVSMVKVQNQVMDTANSSEQAQLVTRVIGSGVRNATALDLQTLPNGDQILRMRTATSAATPTWICSALYVDVPTKTIKSRSSAVAIGTPTQQELSGWASLGSGISSVQGVPILQLSGNTLRLQFSSQVAAETPIVIRTTISQGGGVRISAPCF